jgi:hypothetical protein
MPTGTKVTILLTALSIHAVMLFIHVTKSQKNHKIEFS